VEDDDEEEEEAEEEEEEEEEEQDGGAESELEEGEIDEEAEEAEKKAKKIKKIPAKNVYKKPIDFIEDDDNNDDDGEQYLQKFDQSVNDNYILNFHPESVLQNYDEILSMTKVVRNSDGVIVDKLHRTIPYLTKYEKARILGQRAKQINSGAYPFVKVPENVIDGYIIAEMELKQKRIPFIIRRPLPNGGSEYWRVQDLEDISF
jgi:DNA-directed RNA polymerase I, II, and III subunit RPABC2